MGCFHVDSPLDVWRSRVELRSDMKIGDSQLLPPGFRQTLRFYLTAPSPCPYLEGKNERKAFTNLAIGDPDALHNALSQTGFRRSQGIAYRPACSGCNACRSVRTRVREFSYSRSWRRVLNANSDLVREPAPARATREQYRLLKRYLAGRHFGGGMSSYDPSIPKRSLGTFLILDHIRYAAELGVPHVYLGYWVKGSPKMDYKRRFEPLDVLDGDNWVPLKG